MFQFTLAVGSCGTAIMSERITQSAQLTMSYILCGERIWGGKFMQLITTPKGVTGGCER
jgi:hypothetical protein